MQIAAPMNVGNIGAAGYIAQYQIHTFNTTSGSPAYVHFKTNITSTANKIFMIEALGYNYGTAQPIRCAWQFYAYNGGVSDRGRQNATNTGVTADGVYNSSDGYACIRALASGGWYFAGLILNAYTSAAYGSIIQITASSQNSTSGNYY